jgi:hypothetical protein
LRGPKPTFKYEIGALLRLRIGARPVLNVTVIACVDKKTPHYRIDWTAHGFNELLNDVPIPETSFLGLAGSES